MREKTAEEKEVEIRKYGFLAFEIMKRGIDPSRTYFCSMPSFIIFHIDGIPLAPHAKSYIPEVRRTVLIEKKPIRWNGGSFELKSDFANVTTYHLEDFKNMMEDRDNICYILEDSIMFDGMDETIRAKIKRLDDN
jgi:hypothetical protein